MVLGEKLGVDVAIDEGRNVGDDRGEKIEKSDKNFFKHGD